MKRLALLLPLLALAGCTRDNGASIQIQGICGPTTACRFSGKCDAYVAINPALDTSLTDYMTLFFELENQLPDNSNKETGKLNTNDASIDEAVVKYSGLVAGSQTIGLSERLKASSTGVFGFEVVPASVGAALPAAPPAYPQVAVMNVTVRLRGHLDDGSRFETAEFPFTIDVTGGANAYMIPTTAVACPGACPQLGQYPAGCGQ